MSIDNINNNNSGIWFSNLQDKEEPVIAINGRNFSSSNYRQDDDHLEVRSRHNAAATMMEGMPNASSMPSVEFASPNGNMPGLPTTTAGGSSGVTKTDSSSNSLTVTDAVEHIGMGRFQFLIILIAGLFTFSDAMEMLLLAVLAPILQCDWLLQEYQVALITTVVFIGYLLMAPIWGGLSDHYGRRNTLIVICIWIAFYGFMTAFAPTYGWILILRGLVGAGIAGAGQAFVLTSEYIPLKWRARTLVGTHIFWTLGSLFEIGIAASIVLNVPDDSRVRGWRILVIVSSLPIAFVALALRWLPESARFLVAAGREIEARAILERGARMNRQPKLPGALKPESRTARGDIRELFRPSAGYTTTTLGCWAIWFIGSFCYYGMILLSAILPQHRSCADDPDDLLTGSPNAVICSCSPPTQDTYVSMFISTIGEIASLFLNLLLLDRFGRKRSMSLFMAIQGTAFLLLIPCGMPSEIQTILIFIIRGLTSAFVNAVYIYIAEVYPTRIRAIALGSSSAAARVGALLTPFAAQMLLAQNRAAALVVYGLASFVAAVVSFLMPIEPKDRQLAT